MTSYLAQPPYLAEQQLASFSSFHIQLFALVDQLQAQQQLCYLVLKQQNVYSNVTQYTFFSVFSFSPFIIKFFFSFWSHVVDYAGCPSALKYIINMCKYLGIFRVQSWVLDDKEIWGERNQGIWGVVVEKNTWNIRQRTHTSESILNELNIKLK